MATEDFKAYEAVVMFDYAAEDEAELSVKKGDVITVRDENEHGWVLAFTMGKNGWIPKDFVEEMDEADLKALNDAAVAKEPAATESKEEAAAPATATEEPAASIPEPLAAEPQADSSASKDEDVQKALDELNLAIDQSKKAENADTPICSTCSKPITSAFVTISEQKHHAECFTCVACKISLAGQPYIEKDGAFYCEDDYYRKFNPPCAGCNDVIRGAYVNALGQAWHQEHFVCSECSQPFTGNQFRKHEDKPYCDSCFNKSFGTACSKCGTNIEGQVFEALGKKFHLDCFVCEVDSHVIAAESPFHVYENKVYCPQHFEAMFLQKCSTCSNSITGQYIKIQENHYHPECWSCSCGANLQRDTAQQYRGEFVCPTCFREKVGEAAKARTKAAPKAPQKSENDAASAKATAAHNRAASNTTHSTVKKSSSTVQGLPTIGSEENNEGNGVFYPYSMLKAGEKFPADIDTSRREDYLADDVFEQMFKMTKESFRSLKAWKQQQLKRSLHLF